MFPTKITLVSLVMFALLIPAGIFTQPVTAEDASDNDLNNDFGFEFPQPVTGPRTLLTILIEFSDQRHVHPAFNVSRELFGSRPSMNDYWNETSYGNFYFENKGVWKWITMWDDPDTKGDNATLYDESTRAYWENLFDYGAGKYRWWALKSLDKAGFDFTKFDKNGDNIIFWGGEAALLIVDSLPVGGGANRGLTENRSKQVDWEPSTEMLTMDGKLFVGTGAVVSGGEIGGVRPGVIYAHELGHNALFLPDLYSGSVKPESIHQFSMMCDWWGHHLDAYLKIQLGWIKPTIVVTDGWYNIRDSETNAEAYILHDPDHGTKEYFLVENRWKGTSYDNMFQFTNRSGSDIGDEGLIVWHVDETKPWHTDDPDGFTRLQLVTRDGRWNPNEQEYGESAFNGADEDYYDIYDYSYPRNSHWWSSPKFPLNSGIGIYGVSESRQTMKAYFDIPGGLGTISWLENPVQYIDPRGPIEYVVKIKNTGAYTEQATVYTTGLSSLLVSSVSTQYTLEPDRLVEAIVEISAPDLDCHTDAVLSRFIIVVETTSGRIFKGIHDAAVNMSFTDIEQTLYPLDGNSAESGGSLEFRVGFKNSGNVEASLKNSFEGITNYQAKAFPKQIEPGWVWGLTSTVFKLDPCGKESNADYFTIQIPVSWAGLEDTTYEFNIVATTQFGHEFRIKGSIVVIATMESMFRYNIQNILNSAEAAKYESMKAKFENAAGKMEFALIKYQLGQPLVTITQLEASQNEIDAYIHQVNAQTGKLVNIKEASILIWSAENINRDIDTTIMNLQKNVITLPANDV